MGWLRTRQRGQEERRDTGRDNKLRESQSERERQRKRGKTKRNKRLKEWNENSHPVWMSPS